RLPSSLKLKGNESKYIFKKINEPRLPKEILYRKKQGFSIPLAAWLRGDLRDYINDNLFASSSGFSELFDMDYVQGLWGSHLAGKEDNATPLWGLLMFALWWREFKPSLR
ncbi:MAG: asparagine synthetase B, partial [Deltaproteobacteria bacterium]|nr:asparagine synthetase B [Candidatus Tharpella sp.]